MNKAYVFQESFNGFKVNLICESKLSDSEKLTLARAVRHMTQKLGSDEFKKFCWRYRYSFKVCNGWWRLAWRKCSVKLVHNFKYSSGRNSNEVWMHLLSGKEVLSSEGHDGEADIVLVVDRRNKRGVLGYTYPNSVKQWIYSWFLRSDYRKVAGNLAHEWCHKMGYGHNFRYNQTRKHTVPYAVGYFVAEE
ncbi:MAG: hypothetical protein V2I33_08515 [Kangiellaceae bacterium]|jgi:hypothetical protein|nr:hypothetical protein [Kangiellaceae bacterium]